MSYSPLTELCQQICYRERGGSVLECRTPEREVRGSRPTAAVLCPWARHFTPRKYWLITQEAMAPSRHDWKIVDWDVKPQHNQPNLLSHHLQISKRENRQFGNVVPNSFHFYTRLITKLHGKTSCRLIWFLVRDKFIPLHIARDKVTKNPAAYISMSNHFFFGAEMKGIENHIARFSQI